MKRYTTGFSEEAWAAIVAQVNYIAIENKSPENAARWLGRLLDAVRSLQLIPDRFGVDRAQSAALGREVRRLVFERTYIVFYEIDEAKLSVQAVIFRHGARAGPGGR